MTIKQFLKKYVPKEKQQIAEEELEGVISFYEEKAHTEAFKEALKEASAELHELATEIRYW